MRKDECYGQAAPTMARLIDKHRQPGRSDPMLLGYKANTLYDKHFIVSDLEFHQPGEMIELVARRVMDLQDQGVREALIKMGWTPPPA